MTNKKLVISNKEFIVGYQPQGEWSWLIAIAFFLGNVGAGTFFISYFAKSMLGAAIALLIVGIGKSTAHLLYLGRPERFLNAIRHWQTSWIARGLLAMSLFLIFGIVYELRYLGLSSMPKSIVDSFGVLALIACLVVMIYDGFVMMASKGTPFWRTPILPAVAFGYSIVGGVTVTLLVQWAQGGQPSVSFEWLQAAFIFANISTITTIIVTSLRKGGAAKRSLELLMQGIYASLFFGVAITLGLIVLIVLVITTAVTQNIDMFLVAVCLDLIGHFALFFAVLRVGTHPEIRPSVARLTKGSKSAQLILR